MGVKAQFDGNLERLVLARRPAIPVATGTRFELKGGR